MPFDIRSATALVTGASSGLGAEFARRFAARGADLVLVARRADRLEELAATLRSEHGVTVTVVPFDLARPDAGRALRARLDAAGISVHLLVNNAGFGTHVPFLRSEPERVEEEITLNVSSLVDLTRAFVPPMVDAGRGAVVNLASIAAYQPTPGMAVYGATKAFVLHFTEALAFELRGSGVKVLSLAPGPTSTEFFDVAGPAASGGGRFQTAEQVVAAALRALERRSTPASTVSGAANLLTASAARFVPRRVALAIAGRMLRA
ncbi:SDR family NAD(P)-dependent oxidoreductase [Kineococcus sp. R8]|uniref:SDR family NAD(P)-dependent oxidoreductase n=1 Tax=Kineococcus siccus TaxID=2696567 RepID=UPI0014126018|nr:SDR family oxidoreductase [Kineococcus siccus]NAZ84154.1 SDR family NAD(P)-dependent oxidoreductase [Kineococcus siccus]